MFFTISYSVLSLIAWLSLGIVSYKSYDEGLFPLERMSLALRLFCIATAPLTLLIYERHLFSIKDSSALK